MCYIEWAQVVGPSNLGDILMQVYCNKERLKSFLFVKESFSLLFNFPYLIFVFFFFIHYDPFFFFPILSENTPNRGIGVINIKKTNKLNGVRITSELFQRKKRMSY